MKVLTLRCVANHEFEGWFPSIPEAERQLADKTTRCPLCDTAELTRVPSAPRLNLTLPDKAQSGVPAVRAAPDALWLRMLREIARNTEDVGSRFAEEARRIYYRETPERPIRGLATQDERHELEEEGIEIVALPLPPGAEGPLQ